MRNMKWIVISSVSFLLLSVVAFGCDGDCFPETDAAISAEESKNGGEDADVSTSEETEKALKTDEICTFCGSENVVKIIYGRPGEELFEAAERGEVKLGGCVIMKDSPHWYCKDCEHKW